MIGYTQGWKQPTIPRTVWGCTVCRRSSSHHFQTICDIFLTNLSNIFHPQFPCYILTIGTSVLRKNISSCHRMGGMLVIKGVIAMSAKSELIDFILSLTEEQVDKLFTQLPKLSALYGASSETAPQKETSQI